LSGTRKLSRKKKAVDATNAMVMNQNDMPTKSLVLRLWLASMAKVVGVVAQNAKSIVLIRDLALECRCDVIIMVPHAMKWVGPIGIKSHWGDVGYAEFLEGVVVLRVTSVALPVHRQ
jgi:hypothetical protein